MKLSEADLKSFLKEQENVNTKKKTLFDLKLFNKFFTSEDERRELLRSSRRRTTSVRDEVCAGSEKEKM